MSFKVTTAIKKGNWEGDIFTPSTHIFSSNNDFWNDSRNLVTESLIEEYVNSEDIINRKSLFLSNDGNQSVFLVTTEWSSQEKHNEYLSRANFTMGDGPVSKIRFYNVKESDVNNVTFSSDEELGFYYFNVAHLF